MKKLINFLAVVLCIGAVLTSCEKDETRAILKGTVSVPTLAATTTTLNLQQANAANDAITFSWAGTDYGFDAAVSYTLQMARKGSNFASNALTEMNLGAGKTKKFTVTEINKELLKIVAAGQASDIEVRIKADIGGSVAPVYSNVVTIKATPYRDLINYSFPQALWVAGNYQNWSPSTAPKIVDKNAGGTTGNNYEGYINFNNPAPEFKIVKGNDWSAGDFGDAGAGKLGNGGANLKLTDGAGVYLLKANTNSMTWSATKINTWGIIGSATPGDWSASTPMTLNADGTYSITTTLLGGKELKFRANNDWGINFGDNKANGGPDNVPDYGGDNIAIAENGTYVITLDLTVAGNYNYTIKKQ